MFSNYIDTYVYILYKKYIWIKYVHIEIRLFGFNQYLRV